jgi:hypothetical protein
MLILKIINQGLNLLQEALAIRTNNKDTYGALKVIYILLTFIKNNIQSRPTTLEGI